MKVKILIILVAVLCNSNSFSQVNGFGTDGTFGYSYKTNETTMGNPFNWVDITSTGVEVTGLGDDNTAGPYSIGFNFSYYDSLQSDFYIGSNGYVGFGTSMRNIASSSNIYFPPLPTADLNENYMALYNTDLTFSGSGNLGKVYYYTNNIDSLVISFIDAPYWINNTQEWGGSNTFQVILNAADSSITYQYLTMEGVWNESYNAGTYQTVIGIESPSSTYGLEVAHSIIPQNNLNVYIKKKCLDFGDTSEAVYCKGDTIYNKQVINTNGFYYDVLNSTNNCDSIIITDVEMKEIIDTSVILDQYALIADNNEASISWIDCETGLIVEENSSTFSPSYSGNFSALIKENDCNFTTQCYEVITVNINETINKFNIQPNPTTGVFRVHSSENIDKILVVDMYGKQIYSHSTSGNAQNIDLSTQNVGIYFVHITNSNETIIKKVVKQ